MPFSWSNDEGWIVSPPRFAGHGVTFDADGNASYKFANFFGLSEDVATLSEAELDRMPFILAKTVDDKWIFDGDWRIQGGLSNTVAVANGACLCAAMELCTWALKKKSRTILKTQLECRRLAAVEKDKALKAHASPIINEATMLRMFRHTICYHYFIYLQTGGTDEETPIPAIREPDEDITEIMKKVRQTVKDNIVAYDKEIKSKAVEAEIAKQQKEHEDTQKAMAAALKEERLKEAAKAIAVKGKQAPPPPPMPVDKPISAARAARLAEASKSPEQVAFEELAAVRTNSGELRKAAAGAKRARSDDKPAGGAGGSKPKRK